MKMQVILVLKNASAIYVLNPGTTVGCYDLYLYEVDTRYRSRIYFVTRGVSKAIKEKLIS